MLVKLKFASEVQENMLLPLWCLDKTNIDDGFALFGWSTYSLYHTAVVAGRECTVRYPNGMLTFFFDPYLYILLSLSLWKA